MKSNEEAELLEEQESERERNRGRAVWQEGSIGARSWSTRACLFSISYFPPKTSSQSPIHAQAISIAIAEYPSTS